MVEMCASNSWPEFTDTYRRTQPAHQEYEAAKAGLKGLVPDDVRRPSRSCTDSGASFTPVIALASIRKRYPFGAAAELPAAINTRANVAPPLRIGEIPVDRLAQTTLEGLTRVPT